MALGPKKKKPVSAAVWLAEEARASGDESDPRRLDRVAGYALKDAGRRVLAPDRPNLERARGALESVEDPAEAWETLAAREIIPAEWTYAGARQVVVTGHPCGACDDRAPYIGHAPDCERRDVPATVGAALTLAADTNGVLTAEEIARSVFARLFDDETPPSRIVWRVGLLDGKTLPLKPQRPGRARAKSEKPGVWEAATSMASSMLGRTDYPAESGVERSSSRSSTRWSTMNREWINAFYRDVTSNWSWALAVREKRPNPFTPLCEVWMLGYAVEVVDEEAIVLFAPAVLD